MKKIEIKKVYGYKEEAGVAYFLIFWEDRKSSWEPSTNLDCGSAVKRFFNKLHESLVEFESKKSEIENKNKEKELISKLRSLKPANGSIKVLDITEDLPLISHKKNRTPAVGKKTEEVINNKLQGLNVNKEVIKVRDKNMQFYLQEKSGKDEMSDKRLKKNPDYIKAVERFQKDLYIIKDTAINSFSTTESRQRFLIKQGSSGTQSYTEKPRIEKANITNPLEDFNLIISYDLKASCIKRPKYDPFNNRFDNFNCKQLEDVSFLKISMLTLRQRESKCFYSLHEFDISENDDGLISFLLIVRERNLILIDDTDPDYLKIITFNYPVLSDFDIKGKFNLIQISKSEIFHLVEPRIASLISFNNQNINAEALMGCYDGDERYLVHPIILSSLLFNLNFKKIFTFAIYSDNKNRLTRDLDKLARSKGGIAASLMKQTLDYIFIDELYLQFLHALPDLTKKLQEKTKFYVYKIDSTSSLAVKTYEIFKSGAILTFTKNILENIEFPYLFELFKICKDSVNKLVLRVPMALLNGFKQYMNDRKHTIQYVGLTEIYKCLYESVEDFNCNSITEYMKCLKSKYYTEKRYFFIVNDTSYGLDVKTPEDILAIIKKSRS